MFPPDISCLAAARLQLAVSHRGPRDVGVQEILCVCLSFPCGICFKDVVICVEDTPSAQVSWPEEEKEEECEEEEEEEQDLCPEEDIILVIQQHLQGRAEALHNRYSRSLDTILRGRLTETPTVEKLQHLLEHIHRSLLANNTQERARAVQTSAALLQFATSLPGFDTSSTFSKAGEFVLQLGLWISHPASDISRHARGGIYWLYWLLLQKSGLNTSKAADLWCRDRLHDPERLGYRNLARVGEVFGEIFSEDQKSSFLQAGLLAIHHPLLRVSQAGLVLTYSILGEAGQLLEDEEDITANITVQLFNIRMLGQVPDALQGLCSLGQH
ncbi:maestro heat-like repeat-containing protein family member 7 [Mauremys reevesii]|uniref:maestro heat-like repeat-containing protein family member 7 n=1 Tax=Mauremys reevesii TaxID=260615 RepID=UPI00193FBBFE|nr:maestro heat-like repeat-containing protein family member 7 [Mauremys reevesii]